LEEKVDLEIIIILITKFVILLSLISSPFL